MRTPSLLAILLIGFAAACAPAGPAELERSSAPIINGEACTAKELPQTAALIIDATISFGGDSTPFRTLLCTATLIAPDVALTAAHCVDPSALTGGFATLSDLKYYLSFEPDLRALTDMQSLPPLPADARLVRSVVKHEDFSFEGSEPPDGLSNFSDIGLIFLDETIDDIEPAIVITPEEAADLAVGDEVRIAGWGRQTAEESDAVGTKHCATAAIFEIGDFEMQIGNEPTTSRKCHGDSGGPTYAELATDTRRKGRVIGATSRAYDSSDCQRGGVDTMASAHYEWIDAQMSARCEAGERAWCDVSGVVLPEFYDTIEEEGTPEEGGCSAAGSSKGSAALLALALLLLGLRRRGDGAMTITYRTS